MLFLVISSPRPERPSQWAEIIPAAFEVMPLVDPERAKRYLKKKR